MLPIRNSEISLKLLQSSFMLTMLHIAFLFDMHISFRIDAPSVNYAERNLSHSTGMDPASKGRDNFSNI